MSSAQRLRIWHAGGYELAENARWHAGRLTFVDILAGDLYETGGPDEDPRRLVHLDVPLGAVAPIAGGPHHWIAAAGPGFALIDQAGQLTWLDRPEDAANGATRMNDGACDLAGRFWAGSMAYDNSPGAGSLYRVDHDGTVGRVLDGITICNGPAFDPGGTVMYVADTAVGVVYRCTLADDGSIRDRSHFLTISDGGPDGMTVDRTGRLWVAVWGAHAVRCYTPDGVLAQAVSIPAPQPTSVCLGGPQGQTLIVTTARQGLADAAPESGAILAVDVDAQGVAPATCRLHV